MSNSWYYRYLFEKENAEWMCSVTYLRLPNWDMSMWRVKASGKPLPHNR